MVAAGRARATRAALIDDPFAEPLVRAVGVDFFTRWAAGELDAADVDVPGAPWGMQRMTDLLAARTRYIDAFFSDAGDAGIRQVVILAAGLDARGYRLPWAPGTTVFEVDQPQVIEFKTATIGALGAQPTADVRAVAIDLRHDWPSALRQAGFDSAQPAAWAAEGLLGFLPPDAQDRLLDNITALSADGSRLVAEVFLNSRHQRGCFERAPAKSGARRVSTSRSAIWASRATAMTRRPTWRSTAGRRLALRSISCWPTTDYRCSPVTPTPRSAGTTTAPRCCTTERPVDAKQQPRQAT